MILRGNERAQRSLHEWLSEVRTMPSKRSIVLSGARRKGAIEKAAARCIVIQGAVGVGKTTLAKDAPIEAHFSNVVVFSGPELEAEDLVKMKRVVPTFHRVAPAIVVDDADCVPHQMRDSFSETVKSINYRVPIILVATSAVIPESDGGTLARALSENIVVTLYPCNARDAEALLPSGCNRKMAMVCKGDIRHAVAQTQIGPNVMPDKDFGGAWGTRAAATAALSGRRAEGGVDSVITNLASRSGASQYALTHAHDLLSNDDLEISSRIAEMSSMIDTFEASYAVDPKMTAQITALELRRHPLRPVVVGAASTQQQQHPSGLSGNKRAKPDAEGGPRFPTLHGSEVARDVYSSESKRSRMSWSPLDLPNSLALRDE